MIKKNSYIYGSHFELLDDLAIADRPLKDLIKEIQDTYLADSPIGHVGAEVQKSGPEF